MEKAIMFLKDSIELLNKHMVSKVNACVFTAGYYRAIEDLKAFDLFSSVSPAVQCLPVETLKEIKSAWMSGRKIEAIKLYRATLGSSLKEAKDNCEFLFDVN